MTQTQIVRVAKMLKNFVDSGLHGVTVRRYGVVRHNGKHWYRAYAGDTFGVWREERWRLERGSGIAGRGGFWRLVHLGTPMISLPACKTVHELTSVMRAWRRWELP